MALGDALMPDLHRVETTLTHFIVGNIVLCCSAAITLSTNFYQATLDVQVVPDGHDMNIKHKTAHLVSRALVVNELHHPRFKYA